ncbi:GDSL-like Lipase/Acylhydrolase [Popillia japonica]|uniref:Phospholipase B1, membrane-associated n=1 Tax=Popillia japonica TaxID=7064 RepID=A0AAW1KN06_POPJA
MKMNYLIFATDELAGLDNFYLKGRIGRILADQFIDKIRYQNYRNQLQKNQDTIDDSAPFPCDTIGFRSDKKPDSVHRLKPGDIDVIGAMGDSLTAGFGALSHTLLDLFRDYRGVSFPIGGEKTWRQYLTLPNIIKEYNPNLVGYALRASNTVERASQFNVAEDSAISADMPYMAKVLLKRITSDKRVNVKNDWKLILIFIGANDFCQSCYNEDAETILEKHKRDLLAVLRILRDNLPRTFVGIVNPPYVTLLASFRNVPSECYMSQRFSCPCVVGETHKRRRHEIATLISRWHRLQEDIAGYEEFRTEDFAVVNQPILQNSTAIPTTVGGDIDLTYFAADCFHFSQKGHALVAEALWNSIFQPVGKKQKTIFSDRL